MAKKVNIDGLAAAIEKELQDYSNLATDDMKKAVRKAGNSVKKDIAETAPKKTGKYAKSWTVKTMKDSATELELTVHSRNRYQLAHLLEHGHAKRNGGRTRAFPHIAPAEEKAVEQLEQEIRKSLGG